MPDGNLDTTNLLLGIMAAVSVLQALLLIAVGVMAYRVYARTMQTVREIEQRQVAPLMAKVNTLMARVDDILVDVKQVTTRVTQQTERVDSALRHTLDRVDETAGRVRDTVAQRVNRVLSLAAWARNTIGSVLNGRRASHEAPGHA